jgi:hypothetical protein
MDTWAVIEAGKVVNVVVWDGESDYQPDGELVPLDGPGGIGWDYNPKATKHKFVDNRPPAEDDL